MPRRLWVGVLGVWGPLGCGLTTSDPHASSDPEPPANQSPARDSNADGDENAGGGDSDSNADAAADAGAPGQPGSPPSGDPNPPEADLIGSFVFDLDQARTFVMRCDANVGVPIAEPFEGPLWFGDPCVGRSAGEVEACLRSHPDPARVSTFISCWLPMVYGAKKCWEDCTVVGGIGPHETCWGPGPAPGSPCASQEMRGFLGACPSP